jgi:hypothetical protein
VTATTRQAKPARSGKLKGRRSLHGGAWTDSFFAGEPDAWKDGRDEDLLECGLLLARQIDAQGFDLLQLNRVLATAALARAGVTSFDMERLPL